VVLLVLPLLLAADSPWPAAWRWTPDVPTPSLTLLLGGDVIRREFDLAQETAVMELVLKKYRLSEDGIVVEWLVGLEPWLTMKKKIPGSQSVDSVPLPPGKLISLAVSSQSGTLLAQITLLRK